MSAGAGAGAGAGAAGRAPLLPLPASPRLVDYVLQELKSQGIFDQFRKECISDVDTKPAYQNLRQRVEATVAGFLNVQTWSPDLNKNQLREKLRKHISDSNYLDQGVERIVDQVVNPKIASVFIPHVEEIVSRCLGLEKPAETENPANGDHYTPTKGQPNPENLLPNDLESVSPESVKSHCNKSAEIAVENIKTPPLKIPPSIATVDEVQEAKLDLDKFKLSVNSEESDNSNEEEFESPAFEPLEINFPTKEESQLSGVSDEFKVKTEKEVKIEKELTNSNSKLSQVSSDSNFSADGTDLKSKKRVTDFKNTIDKEKEYDSNNFCEQMEVVEVSRASAYKFNDENSSDARQYGFDETIETNVRVERVASVSTLNDTSVGEVFYREKTEKRTEIGEFENSDKSKKLDSPKMVCTTEMLVDSNESNGVFPQNKNESESVKNSFSFENKIPSDDRNMDVNDSSDSSLKTDLSKENVPKSDVEEASGIIKSPAEETKPKEDESKRSHRERKDSSNYKGSKERDRHSSHNSKDRDKKDDSKHHSSKSSHSRHSSSGRRDSDRRHSSSHDRRDSYSSKSDKPSHSTSDSKDRQSKDRHGKYSSNGDSRKDSKDKHGSSSHRSSGSYKSSKHSDSKHSESRSSEKHSSLSRNDSKDSDRHRDSSKNSSKSDGNKEKTSHSESRRSESDRKSSYSSSKDRSSSKHSTDKSSKPSSETKDDKNSDDKKNKKSSKDDTCSTAGKSRKNRRSSDRDSNDGNGGSNRSSNAGAANTGTAQTTSKPKSSGSSGENSSNGNCSSGHSDSVNIDHVNITKGSYIKSEFNMFQFGSMNAMKRQSSTSEKSPPLKSPDIAAKKIDNSTKFPKDPLKSPRDILKSPGDILKSPKNEESPSEKSLQVKSPEIPSKKPIHIDSQLNPVRIEESLLCERSSVSLIKKPKCASNIFEARKIMKVRKQMEKIERKKKQEAILILEKQQNIPSNASQVYSGLSGPELKIPCGRLDDPKIPIVNGHTKNLDIKKVIPEDFFNVKDDERLSLNIVSLKKIIAKLEKECIKDTNLRNPTTTIIRANNGFKNKNAQTAPILEKVLVVKMVDIYKDRFKKAICDKYMNPTVKIEKMKKISFNENIMNSTYIDTVSSCDFNGLKEDDEHSSDMDLSRKDIMEIILGDMDLNDTTVYFKHTPLTPIKLLHGDDKPMMCSKKTLGLKRRRTSASTSSGSDNCLENINHNNNVKDQPREMKRKTARRSLIQIGSVVDKANEIPGSPDSDKSIENHVNKNVDNTVYKNHKNCIRDDLKDSSFSVLRKNVKIQDLSVKYGKGRIYKAKYLQSRTTPRKLAIVDKAM